MRPPGVLEATRIVGFALGNDVFEVTDGNGARGVLDTRKRAVDHRPLQVKRQSAPRLRRRGDHLDERLRAIAQQAPRRDDDRIRPEIALRTRA